MPLWIPAGIVIGAAAILLGQSSKGHAPSGGGNVLRTGGVNTGTAA